MNYAEAYPPDRYGLTIVARTVTPSRSFIREPSSVPVSDDGHSTESAPDKTTEEVETTVEALAGRRRFPSHGSVIDHRGALALGLKVAFLDQKSPTLAAPVVALQHVRLRLPQGVFTQDI